VLEKAAAIAGDNKAALDAVNYVGKIYDTLVSSGAGDHVIIDMGLVHDIDYYTGLVFRGYMDGAGEPVLAGGRYDTLVARFDNCIPATGFGVNVSEVADTLFRAGSANENKTEVKELVCFDTASLAAAHAYASDNPEAELSPLGSKRENLEYAERKGFNKLVCFENGEKTVFMI
jgi:ATP phosphoribosyltransferase regulatory subunit